MKTMCAAVQGDDTARPPLLLQSAACRSFRLGAGPKVPWVSASAKLDAGDRRGWRLSCCASVLATKKSTPCKSSAIILSTAFAATAADFYHGDFGE